MGWTAFLQHRFAHGLDSLFIAQVCAWAGQPFYSTGLHMGWTAFLLHRFALGMESLFTTQVCTWAGEPVGCIGSIWAGKPLAYEA